MGNGDWVGVGIFGAGTLIGLIADNRRREQARRERTEREKAGLSNPSIPSANLDSEKYDDPMAGWGSYAGEKRFC